MSYQVREDPNDYRKRMEKFLKGIMEIALRSRGVTFSAKAAGEIMLDLMVFDAEVDTFARYCGESGETVLADYWGAKAWAYAAVGKKREGESFFVKSRERRTGGRWAELNQPHYS
jgi:hypothetical protein